MRHCNSYKVGLMKIILPQSVCCSVSEMFEPNTYLDMYTATEIEVYRTKRARDLRAHYRHHYLLNYWTKENLHPPMFIIKCRISIHLYIKLKMNCWKKKIILKDVFLKYFDIIHYVYSILAMYLLNKKMKNCCWTTSIISGKYLLSHASKKHKKALCFLL